jgi:fibronectin-binding autotransporter adhesin
MRSSRSCWTVGPLALLTCASISFGQAIYAWKGASLGNWRTASNWESGPGSFPGLSTQGTGNGSTTDTASFVTPSGNANYRVGLDFTTAATGLNGALTLAAITYSGNVATTGSFLRIGSSSTANGTLTLTGNGVTPNLILANTTTNNTTLWLRPTVNNSNVMSVSLSNNIGEIRASSGNAIRIGDTTIPSSILSGTGGIVKTGDGILTIETTSSYTGATNVSAGTLLVNGDNSTATGAITVANTALLGGNGRLGGATTVQSGGRVLGGTGSSTGTLNVSNVTINSGGTLFANLGVSGTNSTLAFAGNTLDLKTGSVLRLDDVTGYGYGTFNLATFTNGNTLQLDAIGSRPDGFVFGTYQQGVGASGPVVIDVSNLPTLTAGDKLTLQRSGNNLALTFTPVPEPASVLGVCALLIGGVVGVRKLRRAKTTRITPAA